MNVLSVSRLDTNNPMSQRFEAMQDIGLSVTGIDYMTFETTNRMMLFFQSVLYWLFRNNLGNFRLLDLNKTNERILDCFRKNSWDVLWLDKALVVDKQTLQIVQNTQPNCFIIGFSHDDMANRHNQSKQFLEHLPLYDVFYTTKSYNVNELKEMGCKRCKFINNSFHPQVHRPIKFPRSVITQDKYSVGFIGFWEREREYLFRKIAQSGIKINIWGSGWKKCKFRHHNFTIHHGDVRGDEYAKVLCSMDIALCMLRKINRDLQTTRSIEIPACGVFMLGERTNEHLDLFEEGKEAEFFSTASELIRKIYYYLNNPEKRKKIARAGFRRCLQSGYSNQERLKVIFEDPQLKIANKLPSRNLSN